MNVFKPFIILSILFFSTGSLAKGNRAPSLNVSGIILGTATKFNACQFTADKELSNIEKQSGDDWETQKRNELVDIDRAAMSDLFYNILYKTECKTESLPAGVNSIGVTIEVNGIIEGVSAYTTGVDSQAVLYSYLVSIYGNPKTFRTKKLHNRFNAEYDGLYATWVFSDLRIDFFGVEDTLDSGSVIFTTPRGVHKIVDVPAPPKRTHF